MTDDHDSRMFAREMDRTLREKGHSVQYQFLCPAGKTENSNCVEQTVAAEPTAVLLIAGPQDSAHLVRRLREAGFTGPVLGSPAMGRKAFLDQAGAAAEQVVFPLLYPPATASSDFSTRFSRRFGHEPDYAAAHTYDAMTLAITAIQRAGLNRARIRDAIAELSPWSGTTGTVSFDRAREQLAAAIAGDYSRGPRSRR